MSALWKKSEYCFALLTALALLLASRGTIAQTNVTTQHNDIARTGANTNETILAPTNVNTSSFGKLFSQPVDGYVYAQPLYVSGVTMGAGTAQAGTTHNVVFVATEHDSVYAFDADTNSGANANPLWQVSLIDSAHGAGASEKTVPNGDVSSGDIVPEIGITSTPVIDPTTNTIYVVAKSTVGDTTFIQRLHALDITTGAEKFGGPVALAASVAGTGNGSSGGTLNFDPLWSNNRPGLLLLNGIVYLAFGAHGDNGPWHGWLLAYNASTLHQTGVWCATANVAAGGIWMSGTGLAADVPSGKPYGRIFTATGNGTYDATAPNYTNAMDYGDSILKLDLNNGVPTMNSSGTVVGDDFTPHDQANMNNADEDVASGGVVLLPTDSLVQVGKSGRVYIINRESLGGYNSSNTTDPEQAASTGGLWGAPAYWNGNVYVWGNADGLHAFSYSNGTLNSTATSSSVPGANYYSPTPSVSANGTANGIVWALLTDSSVSNTVLYAFNALNVGTTLYASSQNQTRDATGGKVKFIVPTVINGKVYAGSASELDVFGLLNGATQAATPVISPAGQSFNPSIQVTITDSTTGASIYFTTDGSTPTTASTKYTGAFTLTSTSTVNAIAAGTGLLQSPVVSATYTLITQVATPTFNPAPGYYATVQSVSISTTTANATIYYTTDGTTPTTSSTKYTGPVAVGVTETLSAIAIASGLTNSVVSSGLYTIDLGGVSSINFPSGFTTGAMDLLGNAKLNGNTLELTDGANSEASAAWYQVPAQIQSFTTDFTFQITPASPSTADGFTFTLQGDNASAIGPSAGGLGYGPQNTGGTPGIGSSVAVKFDLYNNAGEGSDSTGLYTDGAYPTVPAVDMTSSGVNLHSGDPFHAHFVYDGTTLSMTLTDTSTNASFSYSWTVNIPNVVDGNVAYAGFTGATGGAGATQQILTWTFTANSASTTTATPTFSLSAGTYLGTQTVSISDSTSGAAIFYTLDGTTPATSAGGSTLAYSIPITVSASETINAIATASGYSPSAVATAAYVIKSQVAAPTFSPGAGTYSSPQTVAISTTSPNASIYYTTNGTTPTTSSTVYTAPLTVSASETVQAMATASGFFNSNVSSAAYTINSTQVTSINLGSGFTTGTMLLNGSSVLNGTRLRLTDGGTDEAASAWYNTPVNIQQFNSNFNFQITGGTNPTADGFAFVIQGGTGTAIGPYGGGLGYGPDWSGGPAVIPNSIAVKYDLYSNAGEGNDSTGLYTDGASPTVPAIDMTSSGVNLHTTDIFNVQMIYDGTNLTMVITDTTTNASFTQTWPINIPTTVGGNTAYVGFTGGTGGGTAIQEIIGWTMSSSAGAAATPIISPATGTYTAAQSVTITDATTGSTIYYSTDGTQPTTSSPKYTASFNVSATTTVKAIATATGYSTSAIATSVITINPPAAATPTFSPAGGTYTSAQSVTISDTTSGATIYYTTNGTTPTTSSTVYTAPLTVSASETVQAMATASGFFNSNVSSAAYTINSTQVTSINLGSGFTTGTMLLNGSSVLNGTRLRLTDGGTDEAASAWYNTPVNIQQFNSNFNFQITGGTNPTADGFAFVIQGGTGTAIGPYGGGLGYGPDWSGGPAVIPNSIAVKYDLYSNAGEGNDSTGLYTDGASPTVPAIDMTSSGVNLHTTDIFNVQMIYDGTNLTMVITDTTTNASFTQTWPINIPTTVGGNTAYVGFTGGTGGGTAIQEIIGWTMSSSAGAAATPIISPATGTYTAAQSVTITDATTGSTIYYSTDGTQPTTSSPKYTASFNVSATTTVKAIATATGYSTSAIATSVITINPPAAATPTFSPAGGTYTSAQSVTISDTTSGATIYYTTNGTTP